MSDTQPILLRSIDRVLVCLVLGAMFWRCVQGFDPMPYWSGDPFMVANPPVTILPSGSLVLSALSAFAGLVLLARASLAVPAFVVAFIAFAAAFVPTSTSVDGVLLSADWGAAITGAAGVAATLSLEARRARDATTLAAQPLLRITLAMLLACVAASLSRGLSQYFMEHARTLASFRQDKQAFFASQGWTEQSPMALAFERRISQREASGWFGLANVFATLMAVSTVLLWSVAALARRDGKPWALFAVLGVLAALGVALAGSKAGYAVVLIGLACVGISFVVHRLRPALAASLAARPVRSGLVAVVLACFAVWGGLAVRGSLGESLGERSLLFRAQYHQAALAIASGLGKPIDIAAREGLPVSNAPARVLQGSLALGVGPENFKDRAMLVKPPTLPEDVASPHSLPIDLVLGRGLPGLLMLAVWTALAAGCAGGLWAPARSTQAAASTSSTNAPPELAPDAALDARDPLWLLPVLCCVIPTAFASFAEAPIATLDQRGVRLLACLAACAVALAALHALRRLHASHVHPALAAAGLACCVHLLLELTGVTPGANAWCAMLLGCGAALTPWKAVQSTNAPSRAGRAVRASVLALVVLCLSLAAYFNSSAVANWQASLHRAFLQAQPVQELRMRARALAEGNPLDGDTPALLARETSAALGTPVTANPRAILQAIDALQVQALPLALKELARAQVQQPRHLPTIQALTKVQTLWADAQRTFASPDQAPAANSTASKAIDAMTAFAKEVDTASAWSWLAQLHRTHAAMGFGDAQAHRKLAIAALEQAALLSPYELQHPRQIVALAQEVGDKAQGKAWAQRALLVNDLLRLDPIKQLPERAKAELQAIASQ